jgi:hypothetical protein
MSFLGNIVNALEALIPGCTDDALESPKTGPALLLSDCGLGDAPVDDFVDEWKPSVDDDQGEALESIAWLTARVVHQSGSLWRRDGYMWRGIGHTGGCSPLPALAAPDSPITVVIDNDGTLVCDLSTITSLDGDVRELLSDYLPSKPPRTVNSLGPDERDSRWVSGVGTQWKWDNGRWWHTEPYGVAGIWIAAPYGYTPNASSPYTEATAQPLTFRGWAVPAILEVLSEHQRRFDCNHPRWGDCRCGFKVLDSSDWDEHVGPILADRIACDPQRAMEALRNHQPDKVNR